MQREGSNVWESEECRERGVGVRSVGREKCGE